MSQVKQAVHFHPDYESKKAQILECIAHFDGGGKAVLQGDRNTIKSFEIDGEKINIKSFKVPNPFNAFVYKYIRKPKAERSFEYANKLLGLGIATPFPIAHIEVYSKFGLADSYYVSKHIDYDFDFRVLIHQPRFPERVAILQQFTEFTFKLHENGIEFLDHSPGNTLIVKKSDGQFDFYLIDLNRMRFGSMDFDKRMHNFRRLWLSKTMVKIMADTYSKLYRKGYYETYELMLKHSRDFQRKIDRKKIRRAGRKLKV
ncbi:MAG TPA: lipopolysaccharide kinase InaA family protein [Aquaticitalea sp.]|nr:lipopolysaccharide kinase InaA family protein [Aquaticitalea sp.]HNU59378.1 lipopolysaccharide kinase InaA family protein [Aquaticitalea sp.]